MGLNNLKKVSYLKIERNPELIDLKQLMNLTEIDKLYILYNSKLSEFCGLYNLFSKDHSIIASIRGNASNPTKYDIINRGACLFTISYQMIFPGCNNQQDTLIIANKIIDVGKSFIFPSYNLPSQYSSFQLYYNALVGTTFKVSHSAFDEDINIKIIFKRVCNEENIDNPLTDDIEEIASFNMEIIGSESGYHNPAEYYNFNNNREAGIYIPKESLAKLSDSLGYTLNQLVLFYTKDDQNPDFEDVRKIEYEGYIVFFLKHFSELNLGFKTFLTGLESQSEEIPTEFELYQNYPNPFNPSTIIKFGLPKESKVSLVIYNALGQTVSKLVDEQLNAGYHEVEFNNTNLSSGVYFYTIQAGDFVETKKMIIQR